MLCVCASVSSLCSFVMWIKSTVSLMDLWRFGWFTVLLVFNTVCTYVCMYVCTYVCMYVHMYVFVSCMCVRMYVHAYICYAYFAKSPCITCHMTMKYIMMYPSMVGSVQCDVPTKGCLLCVCVCVSASKVVTVKGYCSLLVLCVFSSTWCTPHKQGPSGAHKEDMVCRVFHRT